MNKNRYFTLIFLSTLLILNHISPKSNDDKISVEEYEIKKSFKKANEVFKKDKAEIIQLKSEIKPLALAPYKKIGGKKYNVKKVKQWDDVMILAALINSECRNCIRQEREVVAQVLRNRVRDNFDGKGSTYYGQVSAHAQFSGFKNGTSTGKYFYYDGRYHIKIINKVYYASDINSFISLYNEREKNKVSFEELNIKRDDISIENYKIAYDVIYNDFKTVPDNLYYFCNSRIATNKKEVRRQRRNKINLKDYYPPDIVALFKHDIFSLG